jgi:hypothetical protein
LTIGTEAGTIGTEAGTVGTETETGSKEEGTGIQNKGNGQFRSLKCGTKAGSGGTKVGAVYRALNWDVESRLWHRGQHEDSEAEIMGTETCPPSRAAGTLTTVEKPLP